MPTGLKIEHLTKEKKISRKESKPYFFFNLRETKPDLALLRKAITSK